MDFCLPKIQFFCSRANARCNPTASAENYPRRRKSDAYELDNDIRSAVQNSDLAEKYMRRMGPDIQEKIVSQAVPIQECIAVVGSQFDWDEELIGAEFADLWRRALDIWRASRRGCLWGYPCAR